MKKPLLIFLPLLLLFSCENGEQDFYKLAANKEIIGSWILFEEHPCFSPIIAVPANPAQVITFNQDGTFTSTFDKLKEFKYYLIKEEDPIFHLKVLKFSRYHPSYRLQYNNSKLEILHSIEKNPTYELRLYDECIEGGHLGFKRIESSPN